MSTFACLDACLAMNDYVANLFFDSRRPEDIAASLLCFHNATVTCLRQLYDAVTELRWYDGAKPSEDAAIEHTERLLYVEESSDFSCFLLVFRPTMDEEVEDHPEGLIPLSCICQLLRCDCL